MTDAPKIRKRRLVFGLAFAAVAIAAVLGGYIFHRSDMERTRRKAGENLTAIGMLKADQIRHWREHNALMSWRLAHGKYLGDILGGTPVPPLAEDLREDLQLQKEPGSEVFLFSTDGRLLLGTPENAAGQTPDPSMPELRKAMEAALAGKETVAADLVAGADGMFYVDFVTAVRTAAGQPTALLVLRSNASEFLFPMLGEWPVPSDTAETLLLRREGDAIVNLSPLRHAPHPPLSKIAGMDRTDLPGVQAALGKVGVVSGVDYRGISVLADVRPVPGSSWFLESEVDMREIFADQPRRLALIGIIAGLLILLAGLAIVYLYRARQARIEQTLEEAEGRFRTYVENSPDGIFVSDELGNYIDLNPAAERISGYSVKELLGKNISDLQYEEDKEAAREMFQRLLVEGRVSGDLRHVTKGGDVRTWHINAVMPDKHRIVGFVSDVEDRKQTEQLVQFNARRADALLKLTDAVETMGESDFMSYGQELAEDLTGSCISFIHFVNDDEKTIELVAWSRRTLEKYCHAAFDRHYPVDKAGIWADALRQRRPVVVNDYASHPHKHGLPDGHSELVRLISVPVIESGKVVMLAGVGNKKTAYIDWDVETVRLIANQIWSLVQRRRGIAALGGSESRLRRLIDASPVPFSINTGEGGISYVNTAFTRAFGYTVADIPTLDAWWAKAYPDPVYREEIKALWAAHAAEAVRCNKPLEPVEASVVCKDGTRRSILASAASLNTDDSGDMVVNIVDITRREDAEMRATQLSQSYLALSECSQAVIDSRDETELFQAVSRAIVDHGGMKMAWVGLVDEAAGAVTSAAAHGEGTDYLLGVNISTDPSAPRGRGPTGTAIRENRPVWCHDFANDPMTAPWRERGAKFGWACMAALPLRRGGRVVGALILYSGKMEAFGEDVRSLFVEMAANISFALDNFDRENARAKAEIALQSSRDMLVKVINASPQSVFWKDRNSIYLGCNERFARSAGLARSDEIVGKSDFDLPRPRKDAERYVADDAEVMEKNEPKLHFTEQLQLADGRRIWIDTSKVPLTDVQGRVYGILGMHEDVTQRKAAEDELLRLRAAVEQSANIIVITNTEGTIEYVNPAFERATGYTASEAIGQNPRILSSGDQGAEFYRNLWNTLISGRSWSGQFHNKRKDGSLFWEFATISPVMGEDGRIRSFIAVKQDISERKAMEQDLLEAKDRAEAASRAKSEFLAVMSHELRTPLNGVLGFAELLADSPLDEEQVEFVHTIRSSGNHLLQVVNDILDFSSIEEKGVSLHASVVVVSVVAGGACDTVRAAAIEKGLDLNLELDPQTPATVWGDALRIRQILINLLGNAVKFTAAGSIALKVAPVDEGGRRFVDFAVSDTGTGIAPEILPQLFQPFTQGDSSLRRRYEGTGLGLAISQRLAKAMGGGIRVVSALGSGSTFTFRIPLKDSVPAEAAPSSEPRADVPRKPRPAPGDRCKVLVVEDDAVSRTLAGKLLQSFGYEVESASDGQKAVAAFVPGKFFAILMDMQMPKMDGVAATLAIRAAEAEAGSPRVPIIALTANVMPGDRERCIEAGMDDFLSKPVRRDQLGSMLERFARRS